MNSLYYINQIVTTHVPLLSLCTHNLLIKAPSFYKIYKKKKKKNFIYLLLLIY